MDAMLMLALLRASAMTGAGPDPSLPMTEADKHSALCMRALMRLSMEKIAAKSPLPARLLMQAEENQRMGVVTMVRADGRYGWPGKHSSMACIMAQHTKQSVRMFAAAAMQCGAKPGAELCSAIDRADEFQAGERDYAMIRSFGITALGKDVVVLDAEAPEIGSKRAAGLSPAVAA